MLRDKVFISSVNQPLRFRSPNRGVSHGQNGDAALGRQLSPTDRHPHGLFSTLCWFTSILKSQPRTQIFIAQTLPRFQAALAGMLPWLLSALRSAPSSISVSSLTCEHCAAVAHGRFSLGTFSSQCFP